MDRWIGGWPDGQIDSRMDEQTDTEVMEMLRRLWLADLSSVTFLR